MKKLSFPMRSRPAGPSGFSPLRRAGRPFGGFALPSALVLAAAGPAAALTISFPGIGLIVPDGNPSGVADSREVTSDIVNTESVTVVVSLSGTYNGDLYMYLLKDTGFSVLLNRVGKNGPGAGYADDGMDLTFMDGAVDDVHTYRTETTPSAGSPLLGSWQPDGRLADPDEVTFASPRSAMLSSFNGLQAPGTCPGASPSPAKSRSQESLRWRWAGARSSCGGGAGRVDSDPSKIARAPGAVRGYPRLGARASVSLSPA